MKQFNFFILFFLSVCIISNAQTANDQAIDSLKQQIEIAVEEGNYQRAADLKGVLEIRQQIQKAVESGNFKEAARLNEQLTDNNTNTNKVADEENSKESLLYIFSSGGVGSVGGYINLPHGERVSVTAGDFKKARIPSGKHTLTTNKSGTVASMTYNFQPGKIYFLTYSSILWNFYQRPEIFLVNKEIFKEYTKLEIGDEKDFEPYDFTKEKKSATIKVVQKNKKYLHPIIYVNGEPVIPEFSAKNYYEIAVPSGDLDITFLNRLKKNLDNALGSSGRKFIHIEEGEVKHLELFKDKDDENYFFGFRELDKEEFDKLTKKKDKVVIN